MKGNQGTTDTNGTADTKGQQGETRTAPFLLKASGEKARIDNLDYRGKAPLILDGPWEIRGARFERDVYALDTATSFNGCVFGGNVYHAKGEGAHVGVDNRWTNQEQWGTRALTPAMERELPVHGEYVGRGAESYGGTRESEELRG